MTFLEKLKRQNEQGRFACAGLDPTAKEMPPGLWEDTLLGLVGAARDEAAAFKPNWAFFLRRAEEGGLALLQRLCQRIRVAAPDAAIFLDMKCADIGKTNVGYVGWAFDECGVDAITVHSYMGSEAMAPFLKDPNRGVFVLCRTSNPGAAEMQDVKTADGMPYFQYVAQTVAEKWNTNRNCGLVIGATYPKELALIRGHVPALPLLIPGIGKQEGDLDETIKAATAYAPYGPFVLNTSSDFIYQPTLAESVARLRTINDAARRIVVAR